jgi:excinuclease UvrABC ATPase subunit
MSGASTIPLLPCVSLDETLDFYRALGFEVTYRQTAPNPYAVVRRTDFELHFYGLPKLEPASGHSTCLVVVPDVAPLHAAFAEGLRRALGRLPVSGIPRLTRLKPGQGRFTLVDLSGNSVIFVRREEGASTRTESGTRDFIEVLGARENNLKDVSLRIPRRKLTVFTGVAGSGKSTLIHDVFVAQHPGAIVIDPSAVSTSSRSNPATYTGMLDDIRQLFARANGVSASLFSSNSEGACPHCQGLGLIYIDLAFMDGLKTPCEVCGGKRFTQDVLRHTLRGKSISDVFEMTVVEALPFFREEKLLPILRALDDVGLGYLKLGQPLSTLSGGECQRLKLATELHQDGSIYVMDEPTTGLHMSDVRHLLGIIDRLVDRSNSVILIEHNLDVIQHADWVIDLGPEGGHQGGQVLFQGTPAQLLGCRHSLTAEYLRRHVRSARKPRPVKGASQAGLGGWAPLKFPC